MLKLDSVLEEYDRIVFDIDYFFEVDNTVIVSRVKLLKRMYDFFDLVLWEEKAILKAVGYFRKKRLLGYGELDFVSYLSTTKRDLKEWLRVNETIIITLRSDLLQNLSPYAVRSLSAEDILFHFSKARR